MTDHSFTKTITVDVPPAEAYAAINDVRYWWGNDVEGPTDMLGGRFTFRGEDKHRSVIEVVELVPGERVVWKVGDTHMTFVEEQGEWVDTTIRFDISPTETGSQIVFTHVGLLPHHECYDVCAPAWTFFITDSLQALITTGRGQPLPVWVGRVA